MSTKDATPAAPDESTGKAGAKRPARAKAPRRATAGDVAPKATAAAIEAFAVDEAVEAARDSKLTAISDIVATLARHDTHSVAESLQAIMAGASPDDAALLRKALFAEEAPIYRKLPSNPDDELAEGWREGAYPYKNLMSRKAYEKQKYRLQV